MPNSNISTEVTNSLKGVFTNINTDRLTEIVVAVVLCFIGFLIARFSRMLLSVLSVYALMRISKWSGAADFLLYFPVVCDGEFEGSRL